MSMSFLTTGALNRASAEKLRALGLRPIEIWVPDATAPDFADTIRRQCAALNASADEAEALRWLDEVRASDDDASGHEE